MNKRLHKLCREVYGAKANNEGFSPLVSTTTKIAGVKTTAYIRFDPKNNSQQCIDVLCWLWKQNGNTHCLYTGLSPAKFRADVYKIAMEHIKTEYGVSGIGHIVKDDWFYPAKDFADIGKKEPA